MNDALISEITSFTLAARSRLEQEADETHVANLRTIALSMAAAGQVKPAEFKVAFCQIALFGVSGVVGIWFFLIIKSDMWPGLKTKELTLS